MHRRLYVITGVGLGALLVVMGLSLLVGVQEAALSDVWHALFHFEGSLADHLIRDGRFPRLLAALLCGGLLAASGVMMQAVLRNPLAEPSLLGIPQGAILFVALQGILAGIGLALDTFTLALLGACFSGLLVMGALFQQRGRQDMVSLLLAGSALSMLFIALATLLGLIQNKSFELGFWIAGGFRNITWLHVRALIFVTLVCGCVLMLLSGKMRLLALGDEAALSLGLSVEKIKAMTLISILPICGICVAVAGNISFVGLFVPHILRRLIKDDARILLPLSFLYGGITLALADILARTLQAPYELPVGLFPALGGIPLFLWLLRKEVKV